MFSPLVTQLLNSHVYPNPELVRAVLRAGPPAASDLVAALQRKQAGDQPGFEVLIRLLGWLGSLEDAPALAQIHYRQDTQVIQYHMAASQALAALGAGSRLMAVTRDPAAPLLARISALDALAKMARGSPRLSARLSPWFRRLLEGYVHGVHSLADDDVVLGGTLIRILGIHRDAPTLELLDEASSRHVEWFIASIDAEQARIETARQPAPAPAGPASGEAWLAEYAARYPDTDRLDEWFGSH